VHPPEQVAIRNHWGLYRSWTTAFTASRSQHLGTGSRRGAGHLPTPQSRSPLTSKAARCPENGQLCAIRVLTGAESMSAQVRRVGARLSEDLHHADCPADQRSAQHAAARFEYITGLRPNPTRHARAGWCLRAAGYSWRGLRPGPKAVHNVTVHSPLAAVGVAVAGRASSRSPL
jgi:hypothetical protein